MPLINFSTSFVVLKRERFFDFLPFLVIIRVESHRSFLLLLTFQCAHRSTGTVRSVYSPIRGKVLSEIMKT